MDETTRSPMTVSKSFFEDITKDVPSPVSKDFLDAISAPSEPAPAPAASARYEMAAPGDIAEAVGSVLEVPFRAPLQIAGSVASAIRGGDKAAIADKDSFLTKIIDTANKDAEEYQQKYANNRVVLAPLSLLGAPDDITTQTLTRFPQQAAFSAVSAGAGLAAGLGTAAATTLAGAPLAAPFTGRAAGMAASGGAAYRMQKDNSAKELFEKLNESSMKAAGRAMTPEEWSTAYDRNEGHLIEQGISEAIPEAIGNLLGFELFFGVAKNVFGKQLAKSVIGKSLDKYGAAAVGKFMAIQAEEQLTETWTQQWQHNIDVEMGLKPGETKRSWTSFDDLAQSNKEVFADIFLLTAVMGGGAHVTGRVMDKVNENKAAQLVKDTVKENKLESIPNEFLPSIYQHALDLSTKRPADKDLATASEAFTKEMDRRGIDYDMTAKFSEYLKLDEKIRGDESTGEDVAKWASLRDEFKEKNISPDLYKGYLEYQADINKARKLYGKESEPERKEFNRLVDRIAAKAQWLGLPEEALDKTGIEKGGVVRKPLEPKKGAARDILTEGEPAVRKNLVTAKDILTEGDINIQSEEDLTPENLAAIDKKLEIAGTGGKRGPEGGGDVFSRMPDDTLRGMADQGVAGAKAELKRRAAAPDDKVLDLTGAPGTEKPADLLPSIVAGESDSFEFPEHFTPQDMGDLWDDLYTASEEIAQRNKPKIDALKEERKKLGRDEAAKARKKAIDEEIGTLESESQFVSYHAENAFQAAHDKVTKAVVAGLKKEGIELSEDEITDLPDTITMLQDGRQNPEGWNKPLIQQAVEYIKGEREEGAPRGAEKSAKQESDEAVAKYRKEGHDINDNGVYNNPEKIVVPFSKAAKRTGEIKIAAAPDGFHLGVSIHKNYGDSEGMGYAPAIGQQIYATRDEAIKAGIAVIKGRTKDVDPQGKAAIKDIENFEKGLPKEIKAAGTGGKRGPTEKVEEKKKETKPEEKEADGKAAKAKEEAEAKAKEEEKKARAVKKYLLEHIDEAIETRRAYEKKGMYEGEESPMYVIIDVPLDGKFKILNTVEYLENFKKKVAQLKVTAALNKLPQHSGKPVGKSTDQITKEAEAEVKSYWDKRAEIKERYESIPDQISAAEKRVAKYQEIIRQLDNKEITLKQLGERAKAASDADNADTDAWRDSWFGKTPTYNDVTERLRNIEKQVRELKESGPEIEAQMKELFPGLWKEMFGEGAAKTTPEIPPHSVTKVKSAQVGDNYIATVSEGPHKGVIGTSPHSKEQAVDDMMRAIKRREETGTKNLPDEEEIKAAGTGGKRGPVGEAEPRTPRVMGREAFLSGDQRVAPAGLDAENKKEWYRGWDAANLETPETKADILKEISEISDDELDALLDMPEKKETPPKTTNEAVKNIFAAARDKQKGNIPSAQPKALDDILADVAKEGVEGAGEALKGLYELFGGASLKSFPGGFDEDTYLKAKPHFEAALDHFIKVGKGLREFAATIVVQFGDAIRPYLKQFLKDRRDGVTEEKADEEGEVIDLDENTGKGEGGARTRRKLTDQEKAEKKAKEEAAEEKKARKAAMGEFKNVGYVYDPEKLNQKIKDKPPKSAAKIILDEMVPGKLWAIDFPEGATPGVVRVKDQIQKYLLTFKEHLAEDRDRLRYVSGKTIEDKIEHWLRFRDGSIDMLKEWASDYGKTIQPFIDCFNGQASITNVIFRLQDTVLFGARKEDGTFPSYGDRPNNFHGIVTNRNYVDRPHSLYTFLTDSWQRLLADENDILLSEIDINKRGRNKMVVRSGLPDYREGVELKKTEDFQAPFGFKGVGFGEEGWINQEERNRVIPAAYDAFKDLAATIGAPDNGMSLGGDLAVQFANLGHKAKGAAAAYFPTVQTINFTRDNGDGTMAHEWGHGLHDLASADAKAEINAVIETFYHVYDFDAGTRLVDDLLAKDSMFLKRMVSNKKQVRIEAVKNEVTDRFEDTVRKKTDYYNTAVQMDADYTARKQEMWARAFEAYIYDTLPGKNNYLVNDFVAAGRVGGKAGVGTRLVYPAGKERETFNATIKHLLDGLVWDESGKPSLKDDYVPIEKAHELLLQLQLRYLLEQVEARYTAIWASEPSKDGYFWYRYDETSFGPMMQPDGYEGYDKAFTSEGQNGSGAVCYLTQLHPDDILDYKLTNIQYEGENPTYISKERGGINGGLSSEGEEALEGETAKPDRSPDEEGDIRSGDREGGEDGEGGTFVPGKQRGAVQRGDGDSAEGVHTSPAGNYRITDPTLNDPKSVPVRFSLNLSAVKLLNLIESEDRLASSGTVSFGEAPPGGWTEADKVPENQRTIKASINEKDILAQYSGWGGMSELFAYEPTAAWAGKAELLKAELTDAELRDAASSSTSSYYTPVPVGQFMWKLAQRLGFTNGVVLDPATGANGLFLGTMPADLAHGTALQGIEMDTLSARIASKLYGLASIENKAFQDVKKPNNRYDLTITNVPFERITPTDLKHNKGGHSLHNYFINKMLNLTAPGALSMMITTSNTLDTVGAHLTEYAEKAHFVGAIRLPSGIYSATKVATDILVFRKKIEGGKFTGIPVEEWTTAGEDESTGLTINNYFLKHPEMVAGKLEKITGRFGNEGLRVVGEGDLQANLERIAAAFPDKIVEREAVKEARSIDDIISAPGTVKEGGAYINDKGEVCEKIDGEEVKLPVATASEQKKAAIARGYVNILDQVRATLRAQKTETDDAVVKAEQAKLKKYYDHFVKKFGPVNDPKNHDVYVDYTDSAWVIALEEYDPDTGKVTKIADIFTKNITGIASRPNSADTDHDALAMALDEFGYPNLEYMARLRNSDVESVARGVADKIIENPETGFLETMDEYLSGNVKRKLAVARDMAQSNPEYARNVSLLEAAQPPEIPQHRITARIGASWISPEHLAEFVGDKMGLRNLHAVFNFSPVSNEWSMSFRGKEQYRGYSKGFGENKAEVQRQIAAAKRSIEATTVWGTERMDFFELMKCALMGKRPQVTYTVDRKQFLDEVATQAAEVKLQDIQLEFGRWLFAETERADQAVKRFNDIINTSIPMKADGSHLTFPGKSMWMVTPKEKEALGITDALTFYPHQMNATWKYLKNGNLYLGHEVGTGKTVTMALIAMEAKRLRGKKKVLYVTLNDSTMGQAVQEIKNLYPMANILPVRVSTNEQRKQRSLQKIALNDFDIAIMRQQDLDRIGLSPESERVFIEEEILELREILEEAKRDGARILEQDIQVQLHALEEKLKAPSVHDEAKRKNLFFDDLGIDLMIVDEAHKYKNVPYATRLTRITGLNPVGSPTAKAFFRKTQYMNAQFPKKDGVVLASGTALSNSIAEMYNIQRMLQPQEVKRQGVWSFDRWIANYGDMGSQLEWDGARGQYKVITTNRRIVNAGRLLATAYQNVDSVRADDTPVKRPIIRGGEPQRIKVQPNQYVEDYKRIILERCAALEADPKNAEYEGVPDNMLRIISNMSKVAIDQRLDHHYTNTEMQQDSKIAAASQIMYRRWKEEAKHKGVQLVFADLGIPRKYADKFKYKTEGEIALLSPEELIVYNEEMFEHDGASTGWNTYEGLKKELVKLGIPQNQIAFIHDADHTNKEKKAANLRSLFKKVNAGDIRVLIGSTSKAGTGVNIQGRVSDIHHLDVWWNFSAWEQRNGRGIRAGNLYANEGMPGTYIWNYVTETTVDATRWDKVFAKGKVLNAVLGGDINLDIIEDISDETMSAKMMAAEASGDPLMATQATLLQQVQGLRFEQAAHLDVVRRSKMDLAAIPGRIEALEKRIKDYQRSRDIMDKVTAVRFVGDDRALVLEKHGKEIAEALEKAILTDPGSWPEDKKAALLVFGSHTERDVVEEVEDKDGGKKEKKVKKYAFTPLPVKADIEGAERDPYARWLKISGGILSSVRKLADIKIDKDKKAEVDVRANISRTVTEYLSRLDADETAAKESIAELKGNEPKLEKVIDTPWAKVDELATKDRELREVEAQMAARGVSVGDPETGIPIDKYKGIVPVLEDVADKDEWSFYEGIGYPRQNATIGISKPTDLSRFLKSGKLKPRIASQYNAPDSLQALNGGKPITPATGPVAYTVINNETRFWVPAGTTFLTVDPIQWNLLQRIIGKEGSWHYNDRGTGERYFVHVNATGGRDAFIWAKQERHVPQGVKDIGDKAANRAIAQASIQQRGVRRNALTLDAVQSLFPGQQVAQDGENFTVTLKNGQSATIYGVAAIAENSITLRAGYSQEKLGPKEFIAGSFEGFDVPGWGIIKIVRDNANAPFTLSHESVHWLEKLGVIAPADKVILNARIQKEGKWDKDLSGEENRANWLASFVNGPKPTPNALAQLWQKIQDFIARLVGIRTAGMIGRELQTGKIFEREAQGTEAAAESYAVGDRLRESDIPADDVKPKFLDIKGPNQKIANKAALVFMSWPKTVTAADGSTILLKNPEGGSLADRAKHLIWNDDKNALHIEKAKWLPNVPVTLENAAVRLVDSKSGNRVYVRAYQDGIKHMVVVNPEGAVVEQEPFEGGLITHFPYLRPGRQENMKIDWERDGLGRSQENPNPTSPVSTIPGSQRGTFRGKILSEESEKVKGKEQYSVQSATVDSTSLFPEVEERLKAAKGIKQTPMKQRMKDALVVGWDHFTRHFQHLSPEEDGAVIDVLRVFQDVPAWAKNETTQRLSRFVGKLSPSGREVFGMNIILPDMLRDLDNGTLTVDDEGLPFGYKSRDQVQEDYDHFKALAEANPEILEALEKRNAFMEDLTGQLIEHKLLKKDMANDPAAYFHHQVLLYKNNAENPNFGVSSQDVRTHRKGWQIGRKGSTLDYNTEYIEAEFEVISQALTQIETVKALKEIERLSDIKPQLEAEAKAQNMATFNRKAREMGLAGIEDPLKPFMTRIAFGFRKLANLVTSEDGLYVPEEFDDVIEHIADQEEQRKAAEEDEVPFDYAPHPRMFALLNYLINHGGPGSMPAAMIFKAIAARNKFVKDTVGKDWVTYRDLVPEGYTTHKPEVGSTFYFANSITDQAISQVLAGNKTLPDAVRQVLARGKDAEWVIKEGLAMTLNEFRPKVGDSLPASISKDVLTTWKQWILMNPFRVIKYNINNMSGDLDIAMAYDPKIITGYFWQAFKDLWATFRGKGTETLSDEMSDLIKRGVINTGMTQMDIPDLNNVKAVGDLVDFFDGKSKNALSRWYAMNKKLSTLRENILRLAAYRYFMDKLNAGEIVYGASRKAELDAVENINAKAAKLARELIGDYGNISHAGQYIRERIVPFFSWIEINAPRYVRLFRNLQHEGGGAAFTGVMAWKAAKLGAKAMALMTLVMLWNATFFPDEEDELGETGREQLHLILGRRADGSIITLRFQGALSDALQWFGMENPLEQYRAVKSGRKGAVDMTKDVAFSGMKKLFQGIRPEPKLVYEVLSGQSFFPDPMHPRPIRDTAEHILRTFSLDRIYNRVAGKPKAGGTWETQLTRDIMSMVVAEADPGEQAYYTSRKYIFDWLDKNNKEKPVALPTNRSNALYYYKQALKFGDFDSAAKYLKRYQDLGGQMRDVVASVKRVHPLSSLKLSDRYKFRQTLTPEQKQTLEVATAWYKKHYLESYVEQKKRGAM
jgi:N12 class adenine-specific DNA methylase